jgi:hypothetical protein
VVPAAGLAGERDAVRAPAVLDLEESFRDVEVRSSVLPHGPQLHEMAVGVEVADGELEIEGVDDVVRLHPHGVLAVDHRVGSRRALAEMDDRLGLEVLEDLLDQ